MIDFDFIMATLAKNRPVFHSEADFQHSLAWEIHQKVPESSIRLEYPIRLPSQNGKPWYLDMLVTVDGVRYAIELKYSTAAAEIVSGGEIFGLRYQSAADLMCYSFCLDVHRIEQMIQAGKADGGVAVILANQPYFWTVPTNGKKSNHDDFRIHEGRTLTGTLEWGSTEAKSRQEPIELNGSYHVTWKNYHQFDEVKKYGAFKYMMLSVTAPIGF